MNWPVIWGIIKFDKGEQPFLPKNYFASDRISVRFDKKKSFDASKCFGCEIFKLKENEISFEIMCSTWRPKDLFNNDEEWCTSDLDYFSPDEIDVDERQNFMSVSDVIFYKGEDGKKYTYTFDMLRNRLIDFQKVLIDITRIPNVNEVVFYFTDSHGDYEIDAHKLLEWEIDKYAERYLSFCIEQIKETEGYLYDILDSFYIVHMTEKE